MTQCPLVARFMFIIVVARGDVDYPIRLALAASPKKPHMVGLVCEFVEDAQSVAGILSKYEDYPEMTSMRGNVEVVSMQRTSGFTT